MLFFLVYFYKLTEEEESFHIIAAVTERMISAYMRVALFPRAPESLGML